MTANAAADAMTAQTAFCSGDVPCRVERCVQPCREVELFSGRVTCAIGCELIGGVFPNLRFQQRSDSCCVFVGNAQELFRVVVS